ncbi:hypothetical protein P4S68_12605 [Pseudoalteromonas sp. Hal099]
MVILGILAVTAALVF